MSRGEGPCGLLLLVKLYIKFANPGNNFFGGEGGFLNAVNLKTENCSKLFYPQVRLRLLKLLRRNLSQCSRALSPPLFKLLNLLHPTASRIKTLHLYEE